MSKKSDKKSQVTYSWEGVNRNGKRVKGELAAATITLLKTELRRQGISPTKVRKKSKPLFSRGKSKIRSGDITIFLRQLSTMLSAGIPLAQAFEIISRGSQNPALGSMVAKLKTDLESGTALSQVLRKQKEYFADLVCNLIEAGEQSGTLDTMLSRIAAYKEKTETIKKKVKKALFYPAIVMVIALVITMGLLMFVVPKFATIFSSFGAELPAATQIVMHLSTLAQKYWWIFFAMLGAAGYMFVKMKKTSPSFSFFVDKMTLRIPVLGQIFQKAAIARFTRTLSTTFAAGLPLVDGLQCVSGATGNQLYGKAALQVKDDVATGQQIQMALRQTEMFPPMVIQMVAIGEESGSLESMLSKVADFYEEDVDNAVDNLSSLIEPMIMVILGVLIGGLLIAMYMPIFKLGSVI